MQQQQQQQSQKPRSLILIPECDCINSSVVSSRIYMRQNGLRLQTSSLFHKVDKYIFICARVFNVPLFLSRQGRIPASCIIPISCHKQCVPNMDVQWRSVFKPNSDCVVSVLWTETRGITYFISRITNLERETLIDCTIADRYRHCNSITSR